MNARDVIDFTWRSLAGNRTRTILMLIAMGIGVASVILLTSLGEGARRYVVGEFSSLGTNLLIVLPGRSETTGAGPAMFIGQTPRDLTLEDARALQRSSTIRRIAPVVVGSAHASWQEREREVPVLGSTAELLEIRQWRLSQGSFLPPGDPTDANPVCVIGNKVARELFGAHAAIGQWLRIADRRFRIIGILQTEGRSIGMDVEELVIVPVASAQALFNTPSLFRILVEASSRESIPRARDFILATITKRHQGEEDVTVVTQDAVLATFDRIFRALTLTVAGIAGISLAVAGILVMNIMLVSVTQRTVEIGLLKAIGASGGHIVTLFMTEAALLSLLGGLTGLALGMVGAWTLGRIYPALPAGAPHWAIVMALAVALGTGLLFGILPARRAGRLDPITALSRR